MRPRERPGGCPGPRKCKSRRNGTRSGAFGVGVGAGIGLNRNKEERHPRAQVRHKLPEGKICIFNYIYEVRSSQPLLTDGGGRVSFPAIPTSLPPPMWGSRLQLVQNRCLPLLDCGAQHTPALCAPGQAAVAWHWEALQSQRSERATPHAPSCLHGGAGGTFMDRSVTQASLACGTTRRSKSACAGFRQGTSTHTPLFQQKRAYGICTRHATSVWQANWFSAAIGPVPEATQ